MKDEPDRFSTGEEGLPDEDCSSENIFTLHLLSFSFHSSAFILHPSSSRRQTNNLLGGVLHSDSDCKIES